MDFGRVMREAFPMICQGLAVTVGITALSLVFAVILGMLSCLMGISKVKPLQWISKFYIWLIRGTPLLVQVFYVYFAIPQLLQLIFPGFRMNEFTAGCITLSLNAGAYLSEIFRGGIQAVDKGQMEAARSLGLPKNKAMMKIILPQAIRISIPSVVNQFIITLKDTSIISIVSLREMFYYAKQYTGRTMEMFATYTVVAAMYLIIVTILTFVSKRIERRLDNDNNKKSKSKPAS